MGEAEGLGRPRKGHGGQGEGRRGAGRRGLPTGMGEKMRLWKTTVSTRKAMVRMPTMDQMTKPVGADGAQRAQRQRQGRDSASAAGVAALCTAGPLRGPPRRCPTQALPAFLP